MQQYEFKVIPAPRKADKVKGLKSVEDRFANALMQLMNRLGAEGWDYVRADVLPCDERVGLTGKATNFHNMLVFRRPVAAEVVTALPEVAEVAAASPARLSTQVQEGRAPVVGPARGEEKPAEKTEIAAE